MRNEGMKVYCSHENLLYYYKAFSIKETSGIKPRPDRVVFKELIAECSKLI